MMNKKSALLRKKTIVESVSKIGKEKTYRPKGEWPSGIESDEDLESEEEVFDQAKGGEINAKKGGLFHKEGVESRQYNLAESV